MPKDSSDQIELAVRAAAKRYHLHVDVKDAATCDLNEVGLDVLRGQDCIAIGYCLMMVLACSCLTRARRTLRSSFPTDSS